MNQVIIEKPSTNVNLNISDVLKRHGEVFNDTIRLFGARGLNNGECLIMIAALSAAIVWRTQFPKDSFAQILTICLENASSLFEENIIIPVSTVPDSIFKAIPGAIRK